MSIDNLKSVIPAYAKDLKLNLSSLAADESLSEQQLWGTFLASALASRNDTVIKEISEEAEGYLNAAAFDAAKAAASIMGMNNIYYRFVHISSNKDYQTMQAKLRMNIIGNPGVEKTDFELWSLAVSAINGCGMCIDAHINVTEKGGISKEGIQQTMRIAAVIHAAAQALDIG